MYLKREIYNLANERTALLQMAGEVGACRELSLQLEALKEEQRSAVREREALVADLEEHHCQLDTLKGT